ncbi:uncharacterized protein LOC129225798 [Uloborus diversus]|uniref:uncharacterized protein LOC129225798 n=1 Tax=Uloborus diversus TaxID=327109 RepID=UPI0024098EB2|nr:uncharacterized protein LOC129225798 [Uloborus diversus]
MSIIMGTVGDVSGFVLFTINILLYVSEVSAYYCNHDLCREDQYCCGDNMCCDYVYSPWYFWAGVVFMILVLSACGGLFRYCYESNSYVVHTRYSFKDSYYPTKSASEEDKGLSSVIIDSEAPPAYSVAAYSDTPEDYQRFSSYEQTKHLANSRTTCH